MGIDPNHEHRQRPRTEVKTAAGTPDAGMPLLFRATPQHGHQRADPIARKPTHSQQGTLETARCIPNATNFTAARASNSRRCRLGFRSVPHSWVHSPTLLRRIDSFARSERISRRGFGLASQVRDRLVESAHRSHRTAGDASRVAGAAALGAGAIAFWDNRSTQRYASSDYCPQRRVMERVAIT